MLQPIRSYTCELCHAWFGEEEEWERHVTACGERERRSQVQRLRAAEVRQGEWEYCEEEKVEWNAEPERPKPKAMGYQQLVDVMFPLP